MSPSWFRLISLSALVIVAGFSVPALTQAPKGKKYALLVGVRAYKDAKLSNLNYTENDAEEMARLLNHAGYDEVVVLTTTRGEKAGKAMPTRANIERELKRLLVRLGKHDVVLVGLAGHGVQYDVKVNGKDREESFFCPSDAVLLDTKDRTRLAATMLPFRDLFKQLDDSGAGARLLLIDACRNEVTSGARNAKTDDLPKPADGTVALFACKGGERAHETKKLGKGHGLFFYHVLEALRGKARNEKGEVTWDGLRSHVIREVPQSVRRHIGGGARQTPHQLANIAGDPVLLRVGGKPLTDKDGKKPGAMKSLPRKVTNSIGMTFVLIPAGTYTRGSPVDEERRSKEEAEQEVEITTPFYLGVHEVTQAQYKAVMGRTNNPSEFKGDELPVESVTWADAGSFLKKLSAVKEEKKAGRAYRLPTEAEWEYACRAGTKTRYSFGKQITRELANYGNHIGRTTKVGSYKPNAWGLYDMHGNVYEWVSDWHDGNYYKEGPLVDPEGPTAESNARVKRGGAWSCNRNGSCCRAAFRGSLDPDQKGSNTGFRAVLVLTETATKPEK